MQNGKASANRTQMREIDIEAIYADEWALVEPHLSPNWKTFFRVLWQTPLRTSEALGLKRKDIGEDQLIVYRSKWRERQLDRFAAVPITPELSAEILSWTNNRRLKQFPHTRQAAWLALRTAVRKAGIDRNLHPHSFRHAFGRYGARANLGLSALDHKIRLAGIMGLRTVRSVERYYHSNARENQEFGRRFLEAGR